MPERYLTAREDLARIIAQETSGVKDVRPVPNDYALADRFIKIINGDERFTND